MSRSTEISLLQRGTGVEVVKIELRPIACCSLHRVCGIQLRASYFDLGMWQCSHIEQIIRTYSTAIWYSISHEILFYIAPVEFDAFAAELSL